MVVTSLLGAFTPFYSTYGGSKGAVEHFVRAAAKEFQSKGISVSCVAPGPMDTPFFYAQESKESTEYMKSVSQWQAHRYQGHCSSHQVLGY